MSNIVHHCRYFYIPAIVVQRWYSLTGPAKSLFERPYFEKLKAAPQPGGIICSYIG